VVDGRWRMGGCRGMLLLVLLFGGLVSAVGASCAWAGKGPKCGSAQAGHTDGVVVSKIESQSISFILVQWVRIQYPDINLPFMKVVCFNELEAGR
jgi:hypothetical protein